jgi:hypothetical protein
MVPFAAEQYVDGSTLGNLVLPVISIATATSIWWSHLEP